MIKRAERGEAVEEVEKATGEAKKPIRRRIIHIDDSVVKFKGFMEKVDNMKM